MGQTLFQTERSSTELKISVLNEEKDVRNVKIYRLNPVTSEWEDAPLSAVPTLQKN